MVYVFQFLTKNEQVPGSMFHNRFTGPHMCQPGFHYHNQIPEKKLILLHCFIGFSLWSADSIIFRPVAGQKHHDAKVWQKKDAYLRGNQEADSRKDSETRYILPGYTSSYPLPQKTLPILTAVNMRLATSQHNHLPKPHY